MSNTRGGLKPAQLIMIVNGVEKPPLDCMFNPFEYTLSKQNQWAEEATKGKNTGSPNFVKGGSQTLKLTLYFDTQVHGDGQEKDVSKITDQLWEMMKIAESKDKKKTGKGVPPEVAFSWGRLYFRAVLTSMTQKFTLFNEDGTPIRCTADITLEQKVDRDDVHGKNDPPLPKEPEEVKKMIEGERTDILANNGPKGDPNAHREIAEKNNINDPNRIPPGTPLRM